jgi:ComF family protein
MKIMQFLTDAVANTLFPPRCVVCDGLLEPGQHGIHPQCRKELVPVGEPVCVHCGRPVLSESVEYCFDCGRTHGKTNSFTQGKSLFVYQGEIKNSMYRFKYSNRREYAAFYAEEFVERYAQWLSWVHPEAVVPVPMYKKKQRKRGYNQAEAFAKALGTRLGIPVEKHMVIRVRDTKPQKLLNEEERKNNLKNAFQIAESIVKYNQILLVDDIYTTGSTAEAVTECLHDAGVEEIYFASICIGKGNN